LRKAPAAAVILLPVAHSENNFTWHINIAIVGFNIAILLKE
jgi:hypothetical protein